MFISTMTVENLDDTQILQEVDHPSWTDIESAIRMMDGNLRSTVMLNAPGKDAGFMGIGGGENGVYICFAIDRNGVERKLINAKEESNDTIEVFMGQNNIRSKSEAADLKTILKVAEFYAETGNLNDEFDWQS